MSNANCTNCQRRHKAAQDGFCEEFSVMPQISMCPSHLLDSTVPVVPNKPTGIYIHIDPVFDVPAANART